jgi:hypothetical protein
VRDQVSHPCRTTGKIKALNEISYVYLLNNRCHSYTVVYW